MDANLAPVLFVLVVSLSAIQSEITNGPTNALKNVGDIFTLDCVTSSNNCDGVEWSKMEGAQSPLKVYTNGIILSTFPRERYSVNSSGGCSLTITQLKINDSGRFTCSQVIGDKQYTKGSVLFVVGFTESELCRLNVTSNTLAKDDGYSFSTAINIPAKSVEPSNVILSFLNKAAGETETTDDSQPLTVKTTLTGKANNTDVMPHVCEASLSPNIANDFDTSTATLVVCTTQQLNVSYPVENIHVSSGPYYKDGTVHCSANGHPFPTFEWKLLKSGEVVVAGGTLVITGDVGDQYTCTATNTVKGKLTSQSVTIKVSTKSSYGGVIIGCVLGVIAVGAIVGGLFACRHFAWCPLSKQLRSFTDKKNGNGEKVNVPLTSTSNPPKKPPRLSETPPVPAEV